MAEKRSNKKNTVAKKKSSMRESAAKTRANAAKPKRVRKAASAASKPVGAVSKALRQEYHVIPRGDKESFWTKSRSFTPTYFKNAWNEVKQVSWPGRSETWRLVFAVFIFAIVMGLMIALLDYVLEKVLREVIL